MAELMVQEQDVTLSPEEQKQKEALIKKVDVTDAAQVMAYGHETQQKISEFSDRALQNVRTLDTGEVSGMLTKLVGQLKGFEGAGESKGFFGKLFSNARSQVETMKAAYDKVEVNVNVITDSLTKHKDQLVADINMLEELYRLNQDHFRELNLYIAAGEEKLQELRDTELPALAAKAEASQDPADAQAARDFAEYIERFDKKVHDLRLTRTVSIQMAPQMRLMQNNDNVLAEKIQSTLVNTIPLWKGQMVIALGLAHAAQALQAEQAVTDMTNELLRRNAETLRQGTVQTAKAAERGVVDIETLRLTNQTLIQTLDEVRAIHEQGQAERKAAEKELAGMEETLRCKLLEFAGKSGK
ncbi:MAG: toxic anion resistance protein [Clostridia bacterium]|nr:toxic anion resistance protein [Clostridia bacterium]